MKNILLISNYAHHYRLRIYNYFFSEFKKQGYQFTLLTDGLDDIDFDIHYRAIVEKQSIPRYINIINEVKPDAVIIFLHLKDIVNYPISVYCKLKGIPTVVWNKGVNVKTPNNLIKNKFYYGLHNLASAIVLYTPNELKDITPKNHNKVFYGYNTLSFEGLDKSKVPDEAYVKAKYGIKEENFILFCATIKDDKKLDELLDKPCTDKKMAVVVAGRGISDVQQQKINKLDNYYYIGKVPFDDYEMNALFKAAKYFTTPGDLGLALIQSFYWGRPVVALDVAHSVEVYYLVSGYNGYLAKDMTDFWRFIAELNADEIKYKEYSTHALTTFNEKAHVSKMFGGFNDAVTFAIKQKTQ